MTGPVTFYKTNDLIQGLRVLQELGQGAASTVYLAQDPKTKQIWAVKHVHRESEKDDRFLDQAVAEYEVASKLSHPHIRRIEKIFKERQKLIVLTDVYLVMELVDGTSLEKRPRITLEQAVDIFHQTASAIQHMHDRGFVHADMKPNNIMIVRPCNVKIIDLGQTCPTNTVKKRIQGTPDYIAPEQAQLKPITPQTDVFNLGATMYWVLTGRTIHTMMNQGDGLTDKRDPGFLPKTTPVSQIDPRIHPKLNDLVMQCVENDPAARPQTAQEVADRLQLVLGMLRAKVPATAGKPLAPSDSQLILQIAAGSSGDRESATGSTDVTGARVVPGPKR